MRKLLFLMLGVLLMIIPAPSQAEEPLVASLDKEKIPVGQEAVLSLVVQEEVSPTDAKPVIASLPGIEILYRGSRPTVTVQHGKALKGTEFVYRLVPKTVGIWDIPPISFSFKGKEFRSNALRLEVVEATVRMPSGRVFSMEKSQSEPLPEKEVSTPEVEPKVFMEMTMSDERPFVREPFVVTHRVFCTVPFQFKAFKRVAGGPEFVQIEKLAGVPGLREEEREIAGERYTGRTISETVWFSKEAGERSFDPGEILLLVKRRSNKLFDRSYQERPPAGDFFATSEEKTATLAPRTVHVRPLPEQKPDAFRGAVGHFQLEASLDKQEVEVGQSVTLKLVLKGTGNLEGIKDLPLGRLLFAVSYSSPGSEEMKREKDTVAIQKSFESVLIPKQAGSHELEGVSLWYFNPRLGAYRKTASQPLTLLVKEHASQQTEPAPPAGPSQQEPTLLGKDIYYIKADLGSVRWKRGLYYQHPLFIPLHLSSLFLLFMAGCSRAYQIYLGRQELPRRQHRALKVSYSRLEEARRFLNRGDPQGYAREAEAALFGYFEDKWNRPTVGLTGEGLEALVAQAGGGGTLQGSLRKCVEALNAIRFASGSVSGQEVLESYRLCRDLIASLDELDFSKLQKT